MFDKLVGQIRVLPGTVCYQCLKLLKADGVSKGRNLFICFAVVFVNFCFLKKKTNFLGFVVVVVYNIAEYQFINDSLI